MADSSFDIVSKVDRQEVDNALNQAAKELSQRFDFRAPTPGSPGPASWASSIKADTEERAKAALEVFKEKLVKRVVSLKALDAGEPNLGQGSTSISATSSRASARTTPRRSPS